MSTFAELQSKLTLLKQKKEITTYLVQHLEENFMPMAGGDSKKKLLDDTRSPIPEDAFEEIVVDLNTQIAELKAEIDSILQVSVAAPQQSTPKKSNKKADKAENVQGENQ